MFSMLQNPYPWGMGVTSIPAWLYVREDRRQGVKNNPRTDFRHNTYYCFLKWVNAAKVVNVELMSC